TTDGTMPLGRWSQMLGSTLNRDVYIFHLSTTQAQDAKIVAKLNAKKNVQDFNTAWNNCSDFARELVNEYFPHALQRDAINDLTMTTPKALISSMTSYASDKPALRFYATKYTQIHG